MLVEEKVVGVAEVAEEVVVLEVLVEVEEVCMGTHPFRNCQATFINLLIF